MTTHLPPELLLQVSERIEAAAGLHFPSERLRELDRKIRLAARELAFLDAEAFARWILSSPLAGDQIRMLAGHLLVRETYFFREPPVWGILQNTILPPLIASRGGTNQRLRLWSAACSTGEDAYSIAITVARAALPHRQDWKCIILATDINPDALRYAQFGTYSPWSFRGTSPEVRSHYFRSMSNGQFTIRPEIKQMVTFTGANLLSSTSIPNSGLMDVIFCRDALFYFTPERVKRVLERFYDTLVDGGWLIVGPEDTTYLTALPFVPVLIQGVIVYRKNVLAPRVSVLYPATRPAVPSSTPLPLPPTVLSLPTTHGLFSVLHETPSPRPVVNGTHTSAPQSQEPSLSVAASGQTEMPNEQAHALYAQGQYEQVVNLLLPLCRAVESITSPSTINAQVFSLLARAYANQGLLSDAQHWGEQAIRNDQSNPTLQYTLATIFLAQERTSDAVRALREALSLNPNFGLAHFALGNLLQQQQRHEEAGYHLASALAVLQQTQSDEIVPASEGLTAGRLTELINVMLLK